MLLKKIVFPLLLLATVTLYGQDQQVLLTIGDKEITVEEFERIYRKNNSENTGVQQTPEEYLDLFINFKLKVLEAENLGMDTTQQFLKEFNTYKEELAKPYMTDEESRQKTLEEAYERMKWDLHVSHILIAMPENPLPEDTLKAYEKAMKVRERILQGEPFEKVARATSDDPGAKSNGGDLGYFTVFYMVYPFETAAYNLETGELSMPVRTQFGYHILKVHDRRPARGKVKVAHIFAKAPQQAPGKVKEEAKERIYAAYDSIQSGVSFSRMVKKFSDDKSNAANGGQLPVFGIGRMIPVFEEKAFSLEEPGDISEPFQSFYGWHIVKLIEKKPIGTFEEMEPTLSMQALRGKRSFVATNRFLDKLKEQYGYELYRENLEKFYDLVDTSVFNNEWDIGVTRGFDEPLFRIGDHVVKTTAFAEHIDERQRREEQIPIRNYVNQLFRKFREKEILAYEKSRLPEKYPEYRYIVQEYHDGILLFDLMDEKVWTRAVEDTAGLEAFFEKHREDYMWDRRASGVIVKCDSTVDAERVYRNADKLTRKFWPWDEDKLRKKFCESDTLACIELDPFKVEKGTHEQVDKLGMKPGIGELHRENGKTRFVIIREILEPQPKKLDETRGQVISDYQDHLEDRWVQKLREKYPVEVNEELLSEIEL
mgnify:CR=1 FL=1